MVLALVRYPGRRKPVPVACDEVARPQAAKSLVADDVGLRIQIRQHTGQVRASLCETRAPEPELADHDGQTLDARVLGLQRGHVVLDVGFEG